MNPIPMMSGRYLWLLLLMTLAGVATAVALVAIADPYGLYKLVDRPGFNHIKPRLTRYQEQIKIAQVVALHSSRVIAGNSRAEIGFDPESSGLGSSASGFYNLGIPGMSIDTSRRQIESIQAAGNKLGTVVLALEFLDAIDIHKATPAGGVSTVSAVTSSSISQLAAREFWKVDALYSLTSVKDAVLTLLIQRDSEAESTTSAGFNPLNEYKKFARNDGYNAIFQQRANDYVKAFVRKSKGTLSENDFQNLAAILDNDALTGADIKLVIYPYHAQIMAMFDETGLTPFFLDWKRRILREVDAARRRHPGIKIAMFDFSGFGAYACSRIPAAGDRSAKSPWYWEAGHFKKELGDLVLARIFEDKPTPQLEEHFGYRLEGISGLL